MYILVLTLSLLPHPATNPPCQDPPSWQQPNNSLWHESLENKNNPTSSKGHSLCSLIFCPFKTASLSSWHVKAPTWLSFCQELSWSPPASVPWPPSCISDVACEPRTSYVLIAKQRMGPKLTEVLCLLLIYPITLSFSVEVTLLCT